MSYNNPAGQKKDLFNDLDRLNKTRDLSLPDWGVYSKKYFALSHITDKSRGTLFQSLLIPGITGRKKYFPGKKACFDYVPVDANADLSFYAIRCNMEQETSADLKFYNVADDIQLTETVFNNRSKASINFRLDYALGFQHEGESVKLNLKKDEYFLGAHEYNKISIRCPRDNWDQQIEGTYCNSIFVKRIALQPSFTSEKGATVSYTWKIKNNLKNIKFGIRYCLSGKANAGISINFAGNNIKFSLKPTGEDFSFEVLKICYCSVKQVNKGDQSLTLTMKNPSKTGDLHIDGFFLIPAHVDILKDKRLVQIKPEPNLEYISEKDFFAVKSPLAKGKVYGVMTQAEPNFHVVKYKGTEENFLLHNLHLGLVSRFGTNNYISDEGNEFINGDLRPIFCADNHKVSVKAAIGYATSPDKLKIKLRNALKNWRKDVGNIIRHHQNTSFRINDKRFKTGLESIMAATLTSIHFPQDFLNEYARYFSPGTFYPTLYMWDAGMQGIGLLEYAPQLALEGLNTYLCSKKDPQPVILHGTVMPTQMYLYWEIFLRFANQEIIAGLYDKMRRYYRFMVGKDGSDMDRFGTGLLCPCGYFYNAGGWDDYPPQAFATKNKLNLTMSPVVNTAHGIRSAKIMSLIANIIGKDEHLAEYNADIIRMENALMKYSWDDKCGYFSYVINKGKKKLQFKPGINYNMGLDGVSPLIAGLNNDYISRQLISHCKDPKQLWTPLGLSTVDQCAPYFEYGGYWNGTVWVPHQWFFFRAMLDHGESAFALKIAEAILNAWQHTVITSKGQTYEGIDIRSKQGFGTPYFSALSVPAVSLYKMCFEPGRLTAGFDTIIQNLKYFPKKHRITARISKPFGKCKTGIIAVPGKPGIYNITLGKKAKQVKSDQEGRLIFNINIPDFDKTVEIFPET